MRTMTMPTRLSSDNGDDMLNQSEIEAVREGLKDWDEPLSLVVHTAEDKPELSSALWDAAKQIQEASGGKVDILEQGVTEPAGRPCLTLVRPDRSNLHYMAVPQGLEAPPFVEAIVDMARDRLADPPDLSSQLDALSEPADLLVFIAPTCAHCPNAVRQAIRIAQASGHVSVSIVDIHEFEDLTERFAIRSVPLTVLDSGFAWTGVVDASDMIKRILSRGTRAHDAAVFLSLVENARLPDAQEQILKGAGASYFLSAWHGSTTQLRMGLMLVAEEVLDEDAQSLNTIVSELIETLGAEDAALRGDTADLLSKIGCPSAIPALEALSADPNPDVVEIATEAIEEIRDRQTGE